MGLDKKRVKIDLCASLIATVTTGPAAWPESYEKLGGNKK